MMKTVFAVVVLLLGFSAQGLLEYKMFFSSNHGSSGSIFFARVLRQKIFHSWKIIVTTDSSAKLTWNKRFIRYFEIGILDLYVIWTLGLIMFYNLVPTEMHRDAP